VKVNLTARGVMHQLLYPPRGVEVLAASFKGLDGGGLRSVPDVAVAFEHPLAEVARRSPDRLLADGRRFGQFRIFGER
jgi:hypothetical protein